MRLIAFGTDLTPEANILFASESIIDILGYCPDEVLGKSCFEYFHPEEVPFARNVHSRGVQLDKAAVLHYARIKGRNGEWIDCECVFTIVYEVLVACTSIYRGDAKSERKLSKYTPSTSVDTNSGRAVEAPAIRRLFTSSPRDPRYHMLEHLSSKFRTPPQATSPEPRAALILNRFTRTLTVMYATNAVTSILGITPEQFDGKSFYECIQENCLPDAIRCLESAKANDSIAYLRFWYRDPRRQEDLEDQQMREASHSSDSEDGGVQLNQRMDVDRPVEGMLSRQASHENAGDDPVASAPHQPLVHTSSSDSTDLEHDSPRAIFDRPEPSRLSTSSLAAVSAGERRRARVAPSPRPVIEPHEIEAVVSCTSDGLVVVLRRARPLIPVAPQAAAVPQLGNGLFAAPWGAYPIRLHLHQPDRLRPFQHGLQAPQIPVGGPQLDQFMASIREVAVFAWSLAGINGNIASYGRGVPRGEAQPPGGLPIWDPYAQPSPGYVVPEN